MNEKDYIEKIKSLEENLERERTRRKMFEAQVLDMARDQLPPFEPPTDEDLASMTNVQGPQLRDLIRELVAELR